ncbi:MAG TPA: class I SAM-dependent methyltransferase [Thermoflexia bacterium]|nr:class I SAM-dependent methyltransferase [Thermoflexia bacterium]
MRTRYGRSYFEGLLGQGTPNSPRNRNRLALILSECQQGQLLEIGCGPGHFLRTAAAHFEVTGLDISSYVAGPLAGLSGTQIKQADIENCSLPENKYVVVAAFNVLEHLSSPVLVVQAIYQTLQPGGLLVGSVPHNRGLIGRAHTILTNFFDKTHCSTYPPARWRQLFSAAGFTEVDFFGEVMYGKKQSWYLRGASWQRMAFNLIFRCWKPVY